MYMRVVLINILVPQLAPPPQTKNPSSAPAKDDMIKIYQNAKRRHNRGIIK